MCFEHCCHQEQNKYPSLNKDGEGSVFNKKYIDTSYIIHLLRLSIVTLDDQRVVDGSFWLSLDLTF